MRRPLRAPAAAALASAAPAPRPNVLLLFADDLGINQVNIPGLPFGYTGVGGAITTPHLARFAEEGTTYMQWYSTFHVCTPSRASMMTGRLPIRVGLGAGVLPQTAKGGLPANETTLAEALGALGYETAMFGKWHLGQREQYLPHNHGFGRYFGIPFSCDEGCSPWHGPDPTVCVYKKNVAPIPLLNATPGAAATVVEQPADLSTLTQRYADYGAAFIAEQSAAGRPWFLYASFNHVHVTDANYSAMQPPPGYSDWNYAGPRFCRSSGRGRIGDAVQEMDDAVGQLMDAVSAAGADANTIALFTSDNGNPEYGDVAGNLPLRGYKSHNWEGGIRVGAVARWPGRVAAGRASWALTSTADVFPTAVALAGGSPPPGVVLDGVDISGVLLNGSASPHACLFHWKTDDLTRGGVRGALRRLQSPLHHQRRPGRHAVAAVAGRRPRPAAAVQRPHRLVGERAGRPRLRGVRERHRGDPGGAGGPRRERRAGVLAEPPPLRRERYQLRHLFRPRLAVEVPRVASVHVGPCPMGQEVVYVATKFMQPIKGIF